MKKKTKNFLGILGLSVVALLTGIAINVPSPDAIATSSITDTITVRVVSSDASVGITSPPNNAVFVDPNQKLNFNYANIEDLVITLYVTDANNIQHEYPIYSRGDLDYQPGEEEILLDLTEYGYGDYIIEAEGNGFGEAFSSDSVAFKYVPMTADLEQKDDGSYWEHLTYDHSVVQSVKIEIFKADDPNMTNPLWSNEYSNGEKDVKLPFGEDENVSEAQKYIIRITPYSYGPIKTPLYKPILQELETENIIVPDTGAFFKGLNISRADYLITGLVIFAAFAAFAFVFTMKRRKAYRYNYTRKNKAIAKKSSNSRAIANRKTSYKSANRKPASRKTTNRSYKNRK